MILGLQREAKMNFLLDPNIAYVLVVGCVLLALVAIVVPGTGMPEVTLAFCLVLTGYVVAMLGINLWALAVLALSIVPFLLSLRAGRGRLALVVLSILLLIGGSLFLFVDARGLPAVNPLLAVLVSLASALSIWFGAERAMVAMRKAPVIDPDALVGRSGEARTAIRGQEGTVQAGGELWSARSEKLIEAGSAVRVLRREGFVLIVEKESK